MRYIHLEFIESGNNFSQMERSFEYLNKYHDINEKHFYDRIYRIVIDSPTRFSMCDIRSNDKSMSQPFEMGNKIGKEILDNYDINNRSNIAFIIESPRFIGTALNMPVENIRRFTDGIIHTLCEYFISINEIVGITRKY